MNIVWTDYLQMEKEPEVTVPVPWTREVNMPNPAMFKGEWFAARKEREAKERQDAILARKEARSDMIADILAHIVFYAMGLILIGGSLAGYMAAVVIIGTP